MRPLPKLPRTFEPEQLEFRNSALCDELDSFNKSLFLEMQAMFTATDFYAFAMLGAHDVVGCYSGYFFGPETNRRHTLVLPSFFYFGGRDTEIVNALVTHMIEREPQIRQIIVTLQPKQDPRAFWRLGFDVGGNADKSKTATVYTKLQLKLQGTHL